MFEEFLKEKHAEVYTGTDDDMPDAYEGWLEGLEIDTLILYADIAITKGEIRGLKRAEVLALEAIKNT